MLQLSDIIVLLIIAWATSFWWYAQAARQRALLICRKHCEQQGLQLLDETVSLSRLWIKRDQRGRLRCWRLYTFEFTHSGTDRFRGYVEMLGDQLEIISLGSFRMH